MKLFTLFFACSLGLAHASESYAQTAIVNVEVQNKTVGEILKKIEKQSDFDFFFDNTLIDLNRRVSVTSRNSDIFKVLEKVFKGTNVKYSVLDKKIVLTINADNVQTAQQTTFKVTGKVVDENGEEIIGASVLEKGTKMQIRKEEISFDKVKTRYVRIIAETTSKLPAWHSMPGKNAFLFVDEIGVE